MSKITLELDENQVLFIISVLEAEQETLSGWAKNLDPETQAELKDGLGEATTEIISYMQAQINESRIVNGDEDHYVQGEDRDWIGGYDIDDLS